MALQYPTASIAKSNIQASITQKDALIHRDRTLFPSCSYARLGPRPLPRHRTRPVNLREHVLAAGRKKAVTVTWRRGSKAAMPSRFMFLRIRLAGLNRPGSNGDSIS
ncbi:hypothetical protein [Streptomyces sp. BE133]|uniref:hypothetical protein n=1 Tax=Streptomyces sp. BE133 TaxID=3002523 RepID=UPI002E771BDE|nr:hypothetical protein [Streptomyces sp. BE133]MEE1805068.1 hypothetical protein [Streptomyces sp. BE133]